MTAAKGNLVVTFALVCGLTPTVASGATRQAAPPMCAGQVATIVGTELDDPNLIGTAGADVIVGLGGDDTIDGGPGDDTICGGEGDDIIRSRDGNDVVDAGPGDDLVLGGAGDDRMSGGDGLDIVTWLSATTGVQVDVSAGTAVGEGTDTFTGFEAMSGSSYDDVLTGSAGADYFFPGDGTDVVHGGGGTDLLLFLGPVEADLALHRSTGLPGGEFQEGDVTFDGIEGLAGGAGSTFAGDAGPNALFFASTMLGRGGDDELVGDEGSQTLVGGAGADILTPEPGTDRVDGGPGKDTISYSHAQTGVHVALSAGTGTGDGPGKDTIRNVETVEGSPFRDVLAGDKQPNTLFGKGGNDTMSGAGGDDFLSGGSGTDRAFGGKGSDYCVGSELRSSCEFSEPAALTIVEDSPPTSFRRAARATSAPPTSQLALLGRLARLGPGAPVSGAPPTFWPLGPFAGVRSPENAVTPADDAPDCRSTRGRFVTMIKPPRVVLPLADGSTEEVVVWHATLFRLGPNGKKKAQVKQTPVAHARIAGTGVVPHPDSTPWKSDYEDPYQPYSWLVKTPGRYKWVTSLRWTAAHAAYPAKPANRLSHYVKPGDKPRPNCVFGR